MKINIEINKLLSHVLTDMLENNSFIYFPFYIELKKKIELKKYSLEEIKKECEKIRDLLK